MHEIPELLFDNEDSRLFAEMLSFRPSADNTNYWLSWANSNGLPLYCIRDDDISSISDSDKWLKIKRLSFEQLLPEKLHWEEEYDRASRLLDDHGIKMALIKTCGPFPYWSGNIDAIVDESVFTDAAKILESGNLVRLPWLDEPHKMLFKRFKSGKPVISLHLHSRIAWRSTYIRSSVALNESDKSACRRNRWIIGKPSLAATVLAHAFIEDCRIRLIDMMVLRKCIESGSSVISSAREIAAGEDWVKEFDLSLAAFRKICRERSEQLSERFLWPRTDEENETDLGVFGEHFLSSISRVDILPAKLPSAMIKPFLVRRLLFKERDLVRSQRMSETWLLLSNYARRKLHANPIGKCLIAISGPDGSGKSTMAQRLAELLREIGLDSAVYWSRYGTPPALLLSLSMWRKKNRNMEHKEGYSIEKRSLRPSMKLFTSVIDLYRTSAIGIFLGKNMIFDRHFLDTQADHYMETSIESSLLLKFALKILPRPDFQIILSGSPDVLSERSGEPLTEANRKTEYYDRLSRLSPKESSNTLVLRADNKMEDLIDLVFPSLVKSLQG